MKNNGTEFINRIDFILKEKNLKRLALASYLNITVQAFTDWKRRDSFPSADIAAKIADYLGVDVHWLITGEDKTGLSDDERKLLSNWRDISVEGKNAVRMLLDGYVKQSVEEKNEGVAYS